MKLLTKLFIFLLIIGGLVGAYYYMGGNLSVISTQPATNGCSMEALTYDGGKIIPSYDVLRSYQNITFSDTELIAKGIIQKVDGLYATMCAGGSQ